MDSEGTEAQAKCSGRCRTKVPHILFSSNFSVGRMLWQVSIQSRALSFVIAFVCNTSQRPMQSPAFHGVFDFGFSELFSQLESNEPAALRSNTLRTTRSDESRPPSVECLRLSWPIRFAFGHSIAHLALSTVLNSITSE